jgi:hypothetical protein
MDAADGVKKMLAELVLMAEDEVLATAVEALLKEIGEPGQDFVVAKAETEYGGSVADDSWVLKVRVCALRDIDETRVRELFDRLQDTLVPECRVELNLHPQPHAGPAGN